MTEQQPMQEHHSHSKPSVIRGIANLPFIRSIAEKFRGKQPEQKTSPLPETQHTQPEKAGFVEPDSAAIEKVRTAYPNKIIEVVPAPTETEDLMQQTLKYITNSLLPTVPGYENHTPEMIAQMDNAALQKAVEAIDKIYALRGIILSTGEENISFQTPPPYYSENKEPETHAIKTLDHILQTGADLSATPETTFVSGYIFDLDGRFDANKFVTREVEEFNSRIHLDILQHNPNLRHSVQSVFPAIIAYRREGLEALDRRYQHRFTKPAPEVLAGVFVAPKKP